MSWGTSLNTYLWRDMQAKFVFLNSERYFRRDKNTFMVSPLFYFKDIIL